MKVVAWVALQSKNRGLIKWSLMQAIKQSSTLRFSAKGKKPAPRIVMRNGKQDKEIQNFLEYRKQITETMKKLETERGKRMLIAQ